MIPRDICKLLEKEKFCFLATSYHDRPHISLMNFTYMPEEEVLVLSSRPDTTKVFNMDKNPDVAILLYTLGAGDETPVSCTLYGRAAIMNPGEDRFYRESHFNKHRDMATFIEGEKIAVITIRIKSAVLSDVEDNVRTWNNTGHAQT